MKGAAIAEENDHRGRYARQGSENGIGDDESKDEGRGRQRSNGSEISVDLPTFEIEVQGGEVREYHTGRSGKWGAVFNFTNTIVGAGIIGLPFAMYQCGLIAGILLIFLAAYFTERSSVMLVLSGERLNRLNYEELMEASFGAAGFYVFCFFALCMAFGGMCAYLIIIGDTVPEILTRSSSGGNDDDSQEITARREVVIALFSTLVMLPLSCLRDMHGLSFSSFLSVLADGLILVILMFAGPMAANEDNVDRSGIVTVVRPTLFAGFGAITFAFVSQSSTFILYRSLEKRSVPLWTEVTRWAVGSATVMALGMALTGYLSFGKLTEADVLNNLPSDNVAGNAARGFLAITMVFTYPMEMFVARHVLDASLFQKFGGRGPTTLLRHIAWTSLLWAATTSVALATDNLGVVLEVFGAFSASAIGYVMPAVLFLHVNRREVREAMAAWQPSSEKYHSSLWQRLLALRGWYTPAFMTVFGVIAMVFGVATTVYDEHYSAYGQ